MAQMAAAIVTCVFCLSCGADLLGYVFTCNTDRIELGAWNMAGSQGPGQTTQRLFRYHLQNIYRRRILTANLSSPDEPDAVILPLKAAQAA